MKNVEDILTLSPMQRLMLLHSLIAVGPSALSNQFHYRISGALDHECFRAAWQQLVDRHAALRTGFAWEKLREPVQIVRASAAVDFTYKDLSQFNEPEQTRALCELVDDDRARVFDLRKAPLFRVVLIRLAEQEYAMIWTRHHLILDRWCVDIVFDELYKLYQAEVADTAADLPSVATFRSYIQWLGVQDPAQAEHYWRTVLEGVSLPSLVSSDTTQLRDAHNPKLLSQSLVIENDLYEQVKTLSRTQRISQATIIQGIVALQLGRHCAQRDIVFGMTVSGRPSDLEGVESTMGSYINNVPVRLRLDEQVPFCDWLRTVHKAQAKRFRFDHVSPSELHRWSGLPASVPLFDLLLLMHSPAVEVREDDGIRIEQVQGPLDSAYPMTLGVAESHGKLEFTAVYDEQCVSAEVVQLLLDGLSDLLGTIVQQPDVLLGQLLPPLPVRQVLDEQGAKNASSISNSGINPDDDSVAALTAIWQETLGLDHVGLDDDFFALGGTSIQAALLFAKLELRFNKSLPLSALFKAGSIREFLGLLDEPVTRRSTLVTIQPHGNKMPFYVIPGIGGNVVGLAGLARALGPRHPFYGLESAGLVGEEAPDRRIEDIAARYIHELRAQQQPFVLFGVCWGAAVAFEMARQMTAAGKPPARLIVMDPTFYSAPAQRKGQKPASNGRLTHLFQFLLGRWRLYRNEYSSLKPGERRAWLKAKIKALGKIIKERNLMDGTHAEFRQGLVSKANLAALKAYQPIAYEGETIVYFTADRQYDTEHDPRRLWLEYVASDTPVINIGGRDTGDALSPRYVAALAKRLAADAE